MEENATELGRLGWGVRTRLAAMAALMVAAATEFGLALSFAFGWPMAVGAGIAAFMMACKFALMRLVAVRLDKSVEIASKDLAPDSGADVPERGRIARSLADLSAKAGIACPELRIFENAGKPFEQLNTFCPAGMVGTANKSWVMVGAWACGEFSPDTLSAVLAHEVAHVANGDSLSSWLLHAMFGSAVRNSALAIFLCSLSLAFGLFGGHWLDGGSAILMAAFPTALAAAKLFALAKHAFERKADKLGSELLGSPDGLLSYFEWLSVKHPEKARGAEKRVADLRALSRMRPAPETAAAAA